MRAATVTLVFIAAALVGTPVSAQTAASAGVPITLAEAERRALDRNPDIAQARLGTESADYAVAQAQAAYTPAATASIEHRSQTTAGTTQLTGGTSVNTDNTIYGTRLSQALPWGGGRVSLDFTSGRTATTNLFSTYNPSFTGAVAASVTQPLLRGFGIDSTRAQIAETRIGRTVADLRLRQQSATTLAAVRRAYWEFVYAVDAVQTARQSQQLAERQLGEDRLRAEIGTLAAIDVLQSEAEVATRRQATVQAEGARNAAAVTLKQLIVSEISDPLWGATLVPVDRPAAGSVPVDVSSAIGAAVANRTDIEEARRDRESADLSLRVAENERKPAVDLVLGYTLNGVGGTQVLRDSTELGSSIVGTVPGSYWDALASLAGVDYPTWSAGINVSVPLGRSEADAAAARAKVEQRQTMTRIQALELDAAADVTRAAEQVRSAELQVQSAIVARELAQKRVEAEDARLDAGISTTFLVLQAQRDLAAAQTSELRALLDYRTALVNFEVAQQAP